MGPCALHDGRMPFPRRVGLAVQVMQVAAFPQAPLVGNSESTFPDIECDGVGGIGLQLDRVCARVRCRIDKFKRTIKRLIMIARHLGNDKGCISRADLAAGDGKSRTHDKSLFEYRDSIG
ncbi:hypothetical protein D3C71_1462030 [compost metagenome]